MAIADCTGRGGNETGIPKDARLDAAGCRYYGQFGSTAVSVIVTMELPSVTVTVPLFG